MKRESQKQLPFARVSVLSTENKGELIFFFFLVLNNTLKKQSLLQTRLSPISFRLAPNKILRTVFSCLSSLKLLQITPFAACGDVRDSFLNRSGANGQPGRGHSGGRASGSVLTSQGLLNPSKAIRLSWSFKKTHLINYDPAGHPQPGPGPKLIGDHYA